MKSRASIPAHDEAGDAFYRPAGTPKLRPATARESSTAPAPRYQPPAQSGDQSDEDAFLRARRRVPVRKVLFPNTRLGQIALAVGVLLALAALIALTFAARNMLKHDPRFRIDSSDSIQILGNSEVTRSELLAVFGSDIGRNVFFIPLAERRAALENLPWVQHATVMRLLPNQLRVAIVERTPVAFVRNGNQIALVDANGVLLTMPAATLAARHYSFPVITGIDPADPLSTRTARMQIYQRFLHDLDAAGEKNSQQLSEVDLSDPEDVRAVVPGDLNASTGSELLLHFGDQDFLPRYRNYQANLAAWKQQYSHLASVDLRYEHQVVLEMDKNASAINQDIEPTTAPTPALARGKSVLMAEKPRSIPLSKKLAKSHGKAGNDQPQIAPRVNATQTSPAAATSPVTTHPIPGPETTTSAPYKEPYLVPNAKLPHAPPPNRPPSSPGPNSAPRNKPAHEAAL